MDFTRHTLSQTILYFILLLTVFWSKELFFGANIADVAGDEGLMPLAFEVIGWLDSIASVPVALSIGLLFVNSFFLTRIVVRNIVFLDKTYLPSLLFLIICSVDATIQMHYISQIVVFLLLCTIENIFKVYKRRNAVRQYFMGAFFVGIAALLFLPASLFFLSLFVNLILFHRFVWREWLVSLLGFLTPLFFYSYIYWCIDGNFWVLASEIPAVFDGMFLKRSLDITKIDIQGLIFIVLTIGLVGYAYVQFLMVRNRIRSRMARSYAYFLWFLLFCLVILICCFNTFDTLFPIMAIPLSVMISILFKQAENKIVASALFLSFVISALFANLYVG